MTWAAVSIGLAALYAFVQWKILLGWRAVPTATVAKDFAPTTTVSIIIAARNESQHIEACLKSVFQCHYPTDRFQVILIDDHSTDDTADRAVATAAQYPAIVFQLIRQLPGIFGKKQALKTGIGQSNGTLILTTDADCIVPPNWIRHHVAMVEQHRAHVIAAPVIFRQKDTIFHAFQALDFVGLMGVTAAGINRQWWRMANGANLSYTRKAYDMVHGFDAIDHLASGDDILFMQKVAQNQPESICFIKSNEATVVTEPPPNWRAFFQQRIRWGNKSGAYPEWRIKAVLSVVFAFCWTILINLGLSLWNPGAFLAILALQLLVKAIFDYIVLREVTDFFYMRTLLRYFWICFFLHTVYIAVMGTAGLFLKKYTWKGRRVR